MTGRERMERTFDRLPVDRMPVCTALDLAALDMMPPEWRNVSVFEIFRQIGLEQFQLGDFGFRKGEYTIPPFRIKRGYKTEWETRGNIQIERRIMDGKVLELHTRDRHPVKYPVSNEEELELLCKMWESVEVEELTGSELAASMASFERANEAIGDRGIYVPIVAPSGTQHMREEEAGLENFCEFHVENQELLTRAIEAIQRERQREYELFAKHLRFAKTVIPIENTTSYLTSPALYRQYTLKHMQTYVETMHKYDKKAMIHMCGALKDLLPELKEVGMDGIHGLTPPPRGTCTYDNAFDALGEDLIIYTSWSFLQEDLSGMTEEEIMERMSEAVTPRVRQGNVILGMGADGLCTPPEKFHMVRRWAEKYGWK